MKRIFILLIFLFSVKAYSQENQKLKNAISYLDEHREEIKSQWYTLFDYSAKAKKYIKKRIGGQFEFLVSPLICFKGIFDFDYYIYKDSLNVFLTPEEISSPTIYGNRHFFNSYKSLYLEENLETSKKKENTFYVGFSEPVNNFIVAEVVRNERRLSECNLKFIAEMVKVFFLFDEMDSIKSVYYARLIVN